MGIVLSTGILSIANAQITDPNAGDTFGLSSINKTVKLGGGDVRETAARLIDIALGLLGLITFGLILYGGFLYMTAGGNDEQIGTAKKYIINAIMGLVVILASFAIVQFIFKSLSDATGSGQLSGDGTGGGGGDVPVDVCNPTSAMYNPSQCKNLCTDHPEYTVCQNQSFYVLAITPGARESTTEVTDMSNVKIRVLFSRPLSKDTNLAKSILLTDGGSKDPLPVSTSILENNRVLEVTYANYSLHGDYTVTVNPDLKDVADRTIEEYNNNGINYPMVAHFKIGTIQTDAVKPFISNVTLNGVGGNNLTFLQNDNLTIAGVINDRANAKYGGNGLVKLSIADETGADIMTDYTAPLIQDGSITAFNFNYTTKIGNQFTPGKKYTISITAYDIDSNATTASASFIVKGSHCDDGVQNGDETGIDIGGSCGVDTGLPVITALDPGNGAPGNWISIIGKHFGNKTGTVEFGVDTNGNGVYEAGEWKKADIVNCSGGSSWTDNLVVASVPALSGKAVIKITTADTKVSDSTIDEAGPKPNGDGFFVINDIKRPGLCSVGVTSDTEIKLNKQTVTLLAGTSAAVAKVPVTAHGSAFGAQNGSSKIIFGAQKNPVTGVLSGGYQGEIKNTSDWTQLAVNTKVPDNLLPGYVGVHVWVDGQPSNGVKFQILSPDATLVVPVIESIDPASTTPKSLITLHGTGFGSTIGQVYLADSEEHVQSCGGADAHASCRTLNVDSLPEQCGSTWTDTQVIGMIPENTSAGIYFVALKNNLQFKTNGKNTVTVRAGGP